MSDIFLSYAREDEARVEPLVKALQSNGWSVWWDRQIKPGVRYEDVIEEELAEAECVVAVLSRSALASDFVRSEAAAGRERGILIPVLLEDVRLPVSLNQTQCADLQGWPDDSACIDPLLDCISELISLRRPDEDRLIGRDAELAELESCRVAAEKGRGSIVLVSGEPGIGKTALVAQFSDRIVEQGDLVAVGQCFDEQGAPPYAPWVQILNQTLAEVPPTEALLAEANPLLAAMSGLDLQYDLAPSTLLEGSSGMPTGAELVADARYRMFETVTSFLATIAEERVVVLVLEDIHWADRSTLRLLEFLIRRVVDRGVLVLATYRDVDVRRDHPLFDSLATLNRQPNVHRVSLGGLSSEGVAQVMEHRLPAPVPADLAQEVFRHTEGNPLFVNELVRVIGDELSLRPHGPIEVHIPEGIKETIGRRLNDLSGPCNRLLLMASVLGQEFNQTELNGLLPELSGQDVLTALEEAEMAGIIQPLKALGRYRFSHALIQETLYDEIPLTRRVLLHREAARMLETLYAERLETQLTRIAQHSYRSAQAGDIDKAVDYTLRAAERAEQSLAYEEALKFYGMALDCLEMDPSDQRQKMAKIYYAMGRSGENAGLLHLDRGYADYAKKATELAREVGDQETFARAACDYAKASYFTGDARPVLEEALSMPGISGNARTQCLCFRAIATKHQGRRAEAEQHAQEALAFAEKTEDAQIALAWTQLALMGRPEKLSERLGIGERAVAMAEEAGDRLAILQGYRWLIMGYIEAGDLTRARQALRKHKSAAEELTISHWVGISIVAEAALAMLDADWAGAQTLIEEGERRGAGVYEEGASGTYAVQMHLLQRETGRLLDHASLLIPRVRGQLESPETAQLWNLPGLCVELGLMDEAREVLREVMRNNIAVLPRDDLFSVHIANLADACVALEERDFAQPLYDALLPYAGQFVTHEMALSLGPSDLYLGSLADLMNRREDALQHFDRALHLAGQAPSPPWRTHALHRCGRLLAGSSDRDDRARGAEYLKSAHQLAERLGMRPLAGVCQSLLEGGADVLPDNLTPREMELLRLIAAGRSNKDISRVLDISLNTVATHVRSILIKTHSANRTEAAAYALQQGLV